jgi:hypothetical protein
MRRTWGNPAVVFSDIVVVYGRGRRYNDPAANYRSERVQVDSFFCECIRIKRRQHVANGVAERNSYYAADTYGRGPRLTDCWNV